MTERWVGVVAGAVMLTAHAWAQGTTLEADLQRAVQKMAASGDCQAAVPELHAIAQRAGGSNKSVAAEAQRRIDQCFGRKPDAKPAGPFRALDVDTRASIDGVVSPDGSRVIEQDPRGLVVRDLATGRQRVVFASRDEPAGELTYRVATPVWSPDGKTIAFFAQDRRIKNDIGNAMPASYALRAVNADASESREICKLPAAPPVMSILEWTARGEILYRVGMRVGARGGGGLTPGVGAEFWLVAATGGEPPEVIYDANRKCG